MEANVNVTMKKEYIFDLLLYHMYSKFSGFLINMLGLSVIIMGGYRLKSGNFSLMQALLFVAVGILVIIYNPLMLKIRAGKMIKLKKYQKEISYHFSEQGIVEVIEDKENFYGWKDIKKAMTTPKNVVFYISEQEALIVPKVSFEEKFMTVMNLIVSNMTMDRIYIR
ncbi:MAG TPA: YcxB family protein [Lachnospiraceae bacterium]